LLSSVADVELVNLFFDHQGIDLSDTSIIYEAYKRGNMTFCYRAISHPNCPLLNGFLLIASVNNDKLLVEKLLAEGRIDRSLTLSEAVKVIGNLDISESIKEIIYESYQAIRDTNGDGLAYYAVDSNNLDALKYVIKCDPSSVLYRNKSNRILLDEYVSDKADLIKTAGPNQEWGLILLLLIKHMPDRIEAQLGLKILDVLDAFGELYCSSYAASVCDAIGGITQVQGQSFFKIDLLNHFAGKKNLIIFRALIEKMGSQNINEQQASNRYTALHYVLNMRDIHEDEKESRYEIIEMLIKQNANLDLADASGQTCRQLIESLADPRLSQMIKSQESRASHKC
jgi:hypothetical protein